MALQPTSRPPSSLRNDRVAVVLNGNAKSVTRDVIETVDSILESGDLFVSRRVEDSVGIARTLIDRGYGTILTGGGDGTFTVVVTAVVNEAKRQKAEVPRFGLLRLGTGNSLAWVLGVGQEPGRSGSRKVLAADLERLRSGAGSRWLSLVEAEGILSPFCGFGVDATVLKDYGAVKETLAKGPLKRLAPGALSYFVSATTRTIPGYLFRREPHCRIVNEGSDAIRIGGRGSLMGSPVPRGAVLFEAQAKIASLSTIPYFGFGFRFFPYADERKDRMQLRVSNAPAMEFVRNFRSIWDGTYENLNTIFDYLVDDVTITMDPPTPFQIGGDLRGVRESVRIRLADPIRIVDLYAPPNP